MYVWFAPIHDLPFSRAAHPRVVKSCSPKPSSQQGNHIPMSSTGR